MAKSKIYRGISFIRYKDSKTLSLFDIELVKQDLLNHIYTRFKERIKMPRFGTRIPDMLFEPLDSEILEAIEDDLVTVVNYDPRVEFSIENAPFEGGIEITPLYDENAVIATVELFYIEFDLTQKLDIRLEFSG